MSVRAKFKVQEISQRDGYQPTHVLKLYPVTNGSPENESFYLFTPSGLIELAVVNDQTAKNFELGKEYYVDFTPAE